jgi:signal transduction histidine kinase
VNLQRSFVARLMLALAALLLTFGIFIALLSRFVVHEYNEEEQQRLSHGLAGHIVAHWPEITKSDRLQDDIAARKALLSMLMVVNPGVQVYTLNADGEVDAYIGPPGMTLQKKVDLGPVRSFLGGAAMPLHGSDPMNPAARRLFSAAMFPARAGETRPPGYLYVVLDSPARAQIAQQISNRRIWQGAFVAALGAMLGTLVTGMFIFQRLSLPLQRLADRMRFYRHGSAKGTTATVNDAEGDEITSIDIAFEDMTQRIENQSERERQQMQAHRETMAGLAHDLRTPLTALHGYLEALASPTPALPETRLRMLGTALAQSDKVRRLTQQLFELAALQSCDELLNREHFRLDELVTDTVQKFEFLSERPPVELVGAAPGQVELLGDIQLIERALTNLIDNAVRHGAGATQVQVSLRQIGNNAEILIEDSGLGLPPELQHRLENGLSVREPPIKRSSGSIGGLGLAIAQRVAALHGGTLRSMISQDGGTKLCFALPLRD